MKNQHKIKLAAWVDSSTRFRSLGMTCRGVVPFCPHGLYLRRCRNGTQAVPYGYAGWWYRSTAQVAFGTQRAGRLPPLQQRTMLFCILRTKNKDRNVKNAALWNKFDCRVVLCAESQNQLIASGNHTFIPSADLPPLQPFVHQYTQCSGDDPSPSNVENTTCADERNHLPTCHPEGAKASRGIYPSGKLYLVLVISAT